jgi:arginine utilization protein RocB
MQTVQTKWQTKEGLLQLLINLVKIRSITGSKDEIALAKYIKEQLLTLSYFQENPGHVRLHPTGDGRFSVTALVKRDETTENTVILVSHFDVVSVEDYGRWKGLAFQPEELTKYFYEHPEVLPEGARRDIENGEWLFGRGVMDMKCGLASQMAMLERAACGLFEGNVMLLAVCDEEVNSLGMITSVPVLLELQKEHQLTYTACLNCEPMFARYPGDETKYIYTGSLGKVLPGFFCYGKESHVGEPLAGLNANMMTSYLTCELELNADFCEQVEGEVTPPPTSLLQKDLKKAYSVQTPHKGVALYNLFLMEKPLEKIMNELIEAAKRAAGNIEKAYKKQACRFADLQHSVPSELTVEVLTFDELLVYAINKHGADAIEQLKFSVYKGKKDNEDERDVTIQFVDEVVSLCHERAPMMVLFLAPPYYPAVSSRKNAKINAITDELLKKAWEQHGVALQKQMYFGGLSDLSYTGLEQPVSSLQKLVDNMPLWGTVYSLPLANLQQLQLPVLNVGPVGKDAHKWTERLDVGYATGPLQHMLQDVIQQLLK